MSPDWKTIRIESSPIEIIDGDRGVNYPKLEEFFEDDYCLFLNTSNVTKQGFNFSKTQFITKEKDSLLGKGKLKKFDIVLTTRGTVGNIAYFDEKIPYKNIRINSGMVIFRNNNVNVVSTKYFYQFLKSNLFRDQVISFSSGSAQPQLPIGDLKRIEFPIPPLSIQNRIAEILSSLDDKIELNRQTNSTLEAIAQAIFKEWFVDFNYPGATGEMIESELGLIPKGWSVKPLDEIATFLNGLALQNYPPENENGYLPVIKIRELKHGVTESSDRASRNLPKDYIIQDGDLLFSWSGTLEVKFWVGGEGALNQHLFKVTSENYPLWFCYHWILHHLTDFRNIAEEKTTTMGHIKREHLSDALCLVPENIDPLDAIIQPIFSKMLGTDKECQLLIKTRELLLPELMTGRFEL